MQLYNGNPMATKPQLLGSDMSEFQIAETVYEGANLANGNNMTGGPILDLFYKQA
jgi:hypothetical protein